jgi:hypothetical protein
MRTFAAVLSLMFLAGCPPTPTPDPVPQPVPSGSACVRACSNLEALKCPEGLDPSCAEACQKVQDGRLTDLAPECLAAAKTPAEASACGTVTCNLELGKSVATCQLACNNVALFKCPEAGECLATCLKATAAKLVDLKVGCLAGAKTKVVLQACGSVTCR